MVFQFDFLTVSDGKKVIVQKLENSLLTLKSTAESFTSAMDAFEKNVQSQKGLPTFQERASFWREHGHVCNAMASRGAMLIYDFHRVQQNIQSLTAKSKWTSSKADRTKLKQSNLEFQARFPHFVKLRNSAAHPAETILSDEFLGQSPVDNFVHGLDFGIPVLLAGSIVNGNYVWTRDNVHLSYEVSLNSAAVLTRCSDLFTEAFNPVSAR